MQKFECGVCLDEQSKRTYGKCRLFIRRSDFPPSICPFDSTIVPEWIKSPQGYKETNGIRYISSLATAILKNKTRPTECNNNLQKGN